MSGLSKIGTALIIVFLISLVAIFAELFYVLWRRRVFHRQSQFPPLATMQGGGAADSNSQTFSDTSFSSSSSFSSKELLYFFFFCNNSRQVSRVEPTSLTPPSVNSAGSCPEDEMEEVIDVFKLQSMYGPSRVLFTIKEEERENDVESDKDKSLCSSAEKGTANSKQHNTSKRVNLEDCFKAADDESTPQVEVEVEVEVEAAAAVGDDHVSGDEITPFSTPCESPLYFTPSASPTRELIDSVQTGNVLGNGQTMSSVRVEL